jgi:hypothetical protein
VKNKIGFEKGGKKEEEIVIQFYYINSVFPLYNNNNILTSNAGALLFKTRHNR